MDLGQLAHTLRQHPDPLEQAKAARAIGRLGKRASYVVTDVVRAVESPHRELRISAVLACVDLARAGVNVAGCLREALKHSEPRRAFPQTAHVLECLEAPGSLS